MELNERFRKMMSEHDKELKCKVVDEFVNRVFEQFTALEIEDSYATVTECKIILGEIANEMKEEKS